MSLKAMAGALSSRVQRMPRVPLTGAADAPWSVISSAHDLYDQPHADRVEILLDAGSVAPECVLAELEEQCQSMDAAWIRCWPGEHCRLPFPKLNATSFGHWSGTGLLHTVPGRSRLKVNT